jgi:hypothetical protein
MTQITSALDSFPAEGTVYKFTPLPNSVRDLQRDYNVRIYPTVAEKEIIIDNGENTSLDYCITPVTGLANGFKGTLQHGRNKIDVTILPKAVYIINIAGKNGKVSSRFIKI